MRELEWSEFGFQTAPECGKFLKNYGQDKC